MRYTAQTQRNGNSLPPHHTNAQPYRDEMGPGLQVKESTRREEWARASGQVGQGVGTPSRPFQPYVDPWRVLRSGPKLRPPRKEGTDERTAT